MPLMMGGTVFRYLTHLVSGCEALDQQSILRGINLVRARRFTATFSFLLSSIRSGEVTLIADPVLFTQKTIRPL